ncbi:hypothetical protein [Duganella aceris]|uniref:Uncharacterized protein n=1 Tax=Duganella aceris TaxID=2703883 RepID=A0ABX0FQV2_9BURK|nr:hypothetical protein [Duganella aceris]NGZ86734.1 hypothetical protein [Duganella aceris]
MSNWIFGRTDQCKPARAALKLAIWAGLAAACFAGATAQADDAIPAPRFKKTVAYRSSVGPFDPAEDTWRLSESKPGSVELNYALRLRAPTLSCTYSRPGNRNHYRNMTLWANSLPDLSQVADSTMNGMSGIKRSLTADIAVSQCPATWGDALTLVWGPTAMDDIKNIIAAREKRDQETTAAWEDQQKKKYGDLIKVWKEAATALPPTTAAQDRALAKQIDSEIGAMEDNLDGLNSKPFDAALRGGLSDRIIRLAQVAYIKSKGLSADGPKRASFDAWDKELAGPAILAVKRIEKIIYYRTHRRLKMAEVFTANNAMAEMKSWSYVDWSNLWPGNMVLIEVMTQQLAGKQLVSADFLKKVTRDLERNRPSGDPGRPFYRFTPVEGKTWVMTGPQQEAEEQSGSNVASGLINVAGAVGDMVRLIEKLDADIRDARVAFWKCYATQCKESGKAFYAYSHAMKAKDDWLFVMPIVSPAIMGPGMAMLGDDNVDGGPIEGCKTEKAALERELGPASQLRQSNPIRAATMVTEVMAGPKTDAWQVCRDRMEYIFRPRF